MKSKLNMWTGERLETFITNETMLEHLHRYAIAYDLVADKTVLDIACGEGYGTYLISKTALNVIGVDIDALTIKKAIKKYKKENIKFLQGDILNIPAIDNLFDIITCFETLEHIEDHEMLITELKRVLKPDGLLLISTPEKRNYSDNSEFKNIFHKKELYGDEFKQLLNSYFKFNTFYQQSSSITSTIIKNNLNELKRFYTGDYTNIKKIESINPIYWIALASNEKANELTSSIFYHQQQLAQLIEYEIKTLKKTKTYRLGNFILSPFKIIRNLFTK